MRQEQHSWSFQQGLENLEQANAAHWAMQRQWVQKEQGARSLQQRQLRARGREQEQEQEQEQRKEQEQWKGAQQGRQQLLQAWSTCSHRLQCSRNTGHRMLGQHRR